MHKQTENDLEQIAADLFEQEKELPGHFPDREKVIWMIRELRGMLFPGFFGGCPEEGQNLSFAAEKLRKIKDELNRQLYAALTFRAGAASEQEIRRETQQICQAFFSRLPDVQRQLKMDVQAIFEGDPAAQSKAEVILSYPGLFAIFVYRVAHELYCKKVPLIPRIMTEYAHSRTGIDIHAGAQIGSYFSIDHGTGIVIGETTEIGDHVKLYQGVTLGALSTRKGQQLSGVKRHPTVKDHVTVYANASVLGGNTVIGENSIIGGSAFVTESVPANTKVMVPNRELAVQGKNQEEPWYWEI
ncbi:MAG: serine O-acetyltransferase EpsC [Oscillospiraceae bacterium]